MDTQQQIRALLNMGAQTQNIVTHYMENIVLDQPSLLKSLRKANDALLIDISWAHDRVNDLIHELTYSDTEYSSVMFSTLCYAILGYIAYQVNRLYKELNNIDSAIIISHEGVSLIAIEREESIYILIRDNSEETELP